MTEAIIIGGFFVGMTYVFYRWLLWLIRSWEQDDDPWIPIADYPSTNKPYDVDTDYDLEPTADEPQTIEELAQVDHRQAIVDAIEEISEEMKQ